MQIIDIYGKPCPTLYALSLISGKWRLPILWKLDQHSSLRFNALKREIPGITNMMLTQCLQDFEAHNLVKRTQYEEIPPHVDYTLTPNGQELLTILKHLHQWGASQLDQSPQ